MWSYNKHGLTGKPFSISHYPITPTDGWKVAIRNRESFSRVFKVTIWPKRRDLEIISDSCLYYFLGKGRFLVIVSITLMDNMNTFEISGVFNLPVPVKDPVAPTNKLPSIVAWYRLETSSIAVNLAQMK